MSDRIVPLTGSDAARRAMAAAGKIKTNEIHTTDQDRIFLENVYLGPAWHGDAADEAAMLALNATAGRGCFPADMCKRTDTATVWICRTNRGALLADWIDLGALPAVVGIWTSGSGVPSDAVGNDGDFYINTATGSIYLRASGTYSSIYTPSGGGGGVSDADDLTYNRQGAEFRSVADALDYLISKGAVSLGGAAYLNVGTTVGTVAAGDDSRFSSTAVGNLLYLHNHQH